MPTPHREGKGRALALALFLAAAFAFGPALWAGFVYDDRRDILLNPAAQAETFLERLPATLRPLLKASYALQDALTGPDPLAFHAVNLGLHLASLLVLFALVQRAARATGREPAEADRLAAMAVALWALHPALADTVAYVSGRSSGLSGLLVLICLWAATGNRPRPVMAFVLALLAPLARETALAVPLLLAAWQITLGQGEAFRDKLRRAVPVWLGALLAALVIAGMARHRELVAFSLDQRAPLEALRANVHAVTGIVGLWLQPWQISILPAQPVVHGWTDPPTLWRLAALGSAALGALALRRRAPLAALAVLWALLALVPTNSVIWRVDPVALRPLYLAGIGLSLLLALALARVRVGALVAAASALGLGVLTFQRAALFQDEVALFADAAAKAPEEARAQLMLGLVLANAGQIEAARAALKAALEIDPFLTEAENALRLLDAGFTQGGGVYPNLP